MRGRVSGQSRLGRSIAMAQQAVMQSVVENLVISELHLQRNTAKEGLQWS